LELEHFLVFSMPSNGGEIEQQDFPYATNQMEQSVLPNEGSLPLVDAVINKTIDPFSTG